MPKRTVPVVTLRRNIAGFWYLLISLEQAAFHFNQLQLLAEIPQLRVAFSHERGPALCVPVLHFRYNHIAGRHDAYVSFRFAFSPDLGIDPIQSEVQNTVLFIDFFRNGKPKRKGILFGRERGGIQKAAVAVDAMEGLGVFEDQAVILPVGGDGFPEQLRERLIDLLKGQAAAGNAAGFLFLDRARIVCFSVTERNTLII